MKMSMYFLQVQSHSQLDPINCLNQNQSLEDVL